MFSLVKNLFNTPGLTSPSTLFTLACSYSPKFRYILLPKTCTLITFVFFKESRLSSKVFSFAKRRPVWIKISTCRTAHTSKNMIIGSGLDVSLFSHVRKAIRDIWLVYIGLRTKIYFGAFQCVNLSMYIIRSYTEGRPHCRTPNPSEGDIKRHPPNTWDKRNACLELEHRFSGPA